MKSHQLHDRYAHEVCTNLYNYYVICLSLGSTVVSPYVGMARKQNGGYNASISVQTLIFHLVVDSTRLKTVRICSLALPQLNSGTKIARKRC